MRKILEMLKNELVNVDWANELDALSTVYGLQAMKIGKVSYYDMRCTNKYELFMRRERAFSGEEYVRVQFSDYENLEERNFKISTKLFDRFVDALEKFAKETEKDRMFKRYKWDITNMASEAFDKFNEAQK